MSTTIKAPGTRPATSAAAQRATISVLDLAPVRSGSTPAEAIAESIDLARRAESLGYHRYWVAEHHFAEGVASSSPAVLMAVLAGATSTIRIGSGAVLIGNQPSAVIVEQFGTLDAAHPGRIDLGIGRTAHRSGPPPAAAIPSGEPTEQVIDGLLLPRPYPLTGLLRDPRVAERQQLVRLPGAEPLPFADQVDQIRALIAGTFTGPSGLTHHVIPGEGAQLDLWLLGSSGGESAQLAGALGLPFAANYHVAPAGVLEAVDAYRAAFRPSALLERPHVMVSADVLVADSDARAHDLARGFGEWVWSIRSGAGAIQYPAPDDLSDLTLTPDQELAVSDRLRTRFVGSPTTVAAQLDTLQRVTGADELLLTTATHDHGDRVHSLELLADSWLGATQPATRHTLTHQN